MTSIRSQQPLKPSLLDRLIDRNPGTPDPPGGYGTHMRDIQDSVCRDLEQLLNTRWRCLDWPADLTELETSMVNYGIPDFTGANLGTQNLREEFRRVIERTIKRFELRLQDVEVILPDKRESLDRSLQFRIEATLPVDPVPQSVAFDSRLEPTTAMFQVSRTAR